MSKLRNLLYILQLEEYNLDRFQSWVKEHKVWEGLERKKKLVWTFKARAIFALAFFINLLTFNRVPDKALIAARKLILPIEFVVKALLVNLAKLKIRRMKNLKVIGITGSFGKTSTKLILEQILAEKFKVLATPQSYNTPLGIARIILTQLTTQHQIFIVEMGAYKRGEIRQLCDLVKPQIGILTGINEQHLERFGSIENIIIAKFELIDALPQDGVAILNWDNKYVRERAQEFPIKKIKYSTDSPGPQGQALQTLQTQLFGRGQLSNVLAAIATATHLGIPTNYQQSTINNLRPIPHRLQLIDPGSGILILDDTFSANPDGFREALEVLSTFEGRRKIIVTPGIVELGEKEKEIHQNLGKKIGQICDFIILVGKSSRTEALAQGIKQTNFNVKNLQTVKDLEAAKKLLSQISRPMDIILFENDLPDQYA